MLCWLSKAEKRSWKSFFNCHKVNSRKKHILAIFRIIFQNNWHNYLRHHPCCRNFENFFPTFFCKITKYDCAKFHVKSISYQDLHKRKGGGGGGGGAMCPPRGMIRQKYPGADRVQQIIVSTNEIYRLAFLKEVVLNCFMKEAVTLRRAPCRKFSIS